MSSDENKGAVTRLIEEVGSHGNLPVADELLAQPLLQRLATRLSLAALGGGYGALSDLRWGPGSLLGRPFRAPPAVPAISVVGFPLSSHLSPTVRQRHLRLAALGPNDGSTPLLDAILPGSLVYPVWSADHYFRSPTRIVRNSGEKIEVAAHWDIYPGMQPI